MTRKVTPNYFLLNVGNVTPWAIMKQLSHPMSHSYSDIKSQARNISSPRAPPTTVGITCSSL